MGCAAATDSKDDSDDPVTTTHDGSAVTPLTLTLGQVWNGKVGGSDSDEDYSSFYTFNTGNNTALAVEISKSSVPHDSDNDRYGIYLFEGAKARGENIAGPSAYDRIAPVFGDLLPNTDYTIQVENWGDEATTYQIRVIAVLAEANEGSVAAPVTLTLGQPHTGYTTSVDNGKSYYKFNTGVHTSVTVSYNQGLLDCSLYDGAEFLSQDRIGYEYLSSGQSLTVSELTPNTDYYVAMEFYSALGEARCSLDLTVTGN